MNLLQSNFHEAWWIRFCLPTDKTGERNLTKLVISSSRWNARWFGYQGDVEMGLRWFTLSMQHHRHGQKGGTFRAFTGWNLFRICSLGWTSQISGILVTIANKIKTLNFRKASRWFTWISLFDEHRRKLPHNLVCPQHFETQRYTKYFLVANMWGAFPSLQLRLAKPPSTMQVGSKAYYRSMAKNPGARSLAINNTKKSRLWRYAQRCGNFLWFVSHQILVFKSNASSTVCRTSIGVTFRAAFLLSWFIHPSPFVCS